MKLSLTNILAIVLCSAAISACSHKTAQPSNEQEVAPKVQPPELLSAPYDIWSAKTLHLKQNGLGFDLGDEAAQKYLELGGTWLAPEFISQEKAQNDKILWASDRSVRWLSGTTATFHFPLDPDDFDDDLTLHLQLRPKVNDSVTVKFYQTANGSESAWTTPKTLKLAPGWNDNTVTIPKSWLNKDGNQLMRLTFPGSYFEGSDRVSAKFVRIELNDAKPKNATAPIEVPQSKLELTPCRIDDTSRDAWSLTNNARIERFVVLPETSSISITAAPSAWLMSDAKLTLTAYYNDIDSEEGDAVPQNNTTDQQSEVILEQTIHPGDDWNQFTAAFPEYLAQHAVRLVLQLKTDDESAQLFPAESGTHAALCLQPPQIDALYPEKRARAVDAIHQDVSRIVLIGIDNLRADRVFSTDHESTAPTLHAMLQHSVYGLALGEAPGYAATTTSFLTGSHLPTHGVNDDQTHLKTSLTTIAEALPSWESHFYTTSNAVEPSRGFAQGFQSSRRLNKESLGSPENAIQTLANDLANSPQNSLFYLHLGTLRLPLSPSDTNFKRFALPNYNGPVTPQAMQNLAVLKNPSPDDSRQFAAYYDATLADVDAALKFLVDALPDNTMLLIYGTHGSSLGETTLGYMQSLSPWEVVVPWIIYNKSTNESTKLNDLIPITELYTALVAWFAQPDDSNQQANLTQPLRTPTHQTPVSYGNGVTATASSNQFYRIRREGIDALFDWNIDGQAFKTQEIKGHAITRRTLREQITP